LDQPSNFTIEKALISVKYKMRKRKPNKNILSTKDFILRMGKFFLISMSFMVVSLLIGVLGYRHYANLSWIDSFYNASMILTGMGPGSILTTTGGKVFSSLYALFSGIVFLTTAAIFISPIAHRLLHLLHVDEDDEEAE
jgi:hypothetical protein